MEDNFFNFIDKLLIENNIPKLDKKKLKIIEKCGEGSQSKVYKCEYNGELVALKVLTEIDIKCLIHELAVIIKIDCHYIPKFMGVILEENRFSYVTKFVYGQTLDEVDFSKHSDEYKLMITKQLSKVVLYFHENNCIHRDLKAENVILDYENKKIYLIDFGIAKVLSSEPQIITRAKGTMCYLAPEIFEIQSINDKKQIVSSITQAVDVWAFCCIVSYIFSGFAPWTNKYKDDSKIIQKVLTKKLEFPIPTNIENPYIIQILKWGLINDYKKRKTMVELDKFIQDL